METCVGYAIWIMPRGKELVQFRKQVLRLSLQYKTPVFNPHITVLGDILGNKNDIIHKAQALVKTIEPYSVKLDEIGYLDSYFRCMFVKAKSAEIFDVNQKARKLFGRTDDPEFMPHLSLMYGNIPEEEKKKIAAKADAKAEINVDSMYLYFCTGRPEEWYMVKELKLQKST